MSPERGAAPPGEDGAGAERLVEGRKQAEGSRELALRRAAQETATVLLADALVEVVEEMRLKGAA